VLVDLQQTEYALGFICLPHSLAIYNGILIVSCGLTFSGGNPPLLQFDLAGAVHPSQCLPLISRIIFAYLRQLYCGHNFESVSAKSGRHGTPTASRCHERNRRSFICDRDKHQRDSYDQLELHPLPPGTLCLSPFRSTFYLTQILTQCNVSTVQLLTQAGRNGFPTHNGDAWTFLTFSPYDSQNIYLLHTYRYVLKR